MISVVIPAYDMHGRGVEFLEELIDSVQIQTFKDYEIIVSDSSRGTRINGLCYRKDVKWFPGKEGAAANLNSAVNHAQGDIIKPMFQDDKFIEVDTLERIDMCFRQSECDWLAMTSFNSGEPQFREYIHTPYPHRDLHNLRIGENTYGSPSALAWRRNYMRFDEKLAWLFDCEFYARMAEQYGVPAFLTSQVYIRQWSGQATYTMATGGQRIADSNYVIEKYR